jgi:membrane-associated protease RseP (regulator of RpoE activity)
MDLYSLSVLIFIALLTVLVIKDRKKFKREFILLLRKTTRGKGFIIKLGTRFPNFWKAVGGVAVVVGFLVSIWIFSALVIATLENLTAEKAVPTVSLVLPSLSSKTVVGPGYILVSFWPFVIAAAILLLVHEGFHGIMAAREKVRIKSLGVGLLLVLPLAFVEPDEKQLKKKGAWPQLRVFAAGSFANFTTALVVWLILGMFYSGFFAPAGVAYTGLYEGFPAADANLTGIITGINGIPISSTEDLKAVLKDIGPKKRIKIRTMVIRDGEVENRTFSLTTAEDPNNKGKGFLGIGGVGNFQSIKEAYTGYKEYINFSVNVFFWVFLINLGVGAFNLLPIRFLDGGRMWEILLRRFVGKRAGDIVNVASYLLALIIFMNFFMGFGLM